VKKYAPTHGPIPVLWIVLEIEGEIDCRIIKYKPMFIKKEFENFGGRTLERRILILGVFLNAPYEKAFGTDDNYLVIGSFYSLKCSLYPCSMKTGRHISD
jgi:hypothetical protein